AASGSRPAKSTPPALRRCRRRFRPGLSAVPLPSPAVGGKGPPAASTRFGDPGACQRVRPFVFGVPGVTAHPLPPDDVPCRGRLEPLPQIDILHRLLVGGQPTALLPA